MTRNILPRSTEMQLNLFHNRSLESYMIEARNEKCNIVLHDEFYVMLQAPEGKSLWARMVRDGHLQPEDVVWVFKKRQDGSREWLAIRLDTGKGKGVLIHLSSWEGKQKLKAMEEKFVSYIHNRKEK